MCIVSFVTKIDIIRRAQRRGASSWGPFGLDADDPAGDPGDVAKGRQAGHRRLLKAGQRQPLHSDPVAGRGLEAGEGAELEYI